MGVCLETRGGGSKGPAEEYWWSHFKRFSTDLGQSVGGSRNQRGDKWGLEGEKSKGVEPSPARGGIYESHEWCRRF